MNWTKEHTAKHGIPFPNFHGSIGLDEATRAQDYAEFLKMIKAFVEPDSNDDYVFFASNKHLSQNSGSFRFIAEQTRLADNVTLVASKFKFLSLDTLLYEMFSKKSKGRPLQLCSDTIELETYKFSRDVL